MPKSVAVLAAVVVLGETAPASSVLPGIPSHRRPWKHLAISRDRYLDHAGRALDLLPTG